VLAAVELDDELLLEADEVHDVGPEHLLTAEPVALHLPPAQAGPEELLGGRRFLA
jgi:hypothetical protein